MCLVTFIYLYLLDTSMIVIVYLCVMGKLAVLLKILNFRNRDSDLEQPALEKGLRRKFV